MLSILYLSILNKNENKECFLNIIKSNAFF